MQDLFTKIQSLPDLLTSQHLCELGLFSTLDACYKARKRKNSPDFIKLSHLVLYPKSSVIDFIQRRLKKGDMCKGENTNVTTP